MKVLHINQSDISGGAAIAGYRLHQGLLQEKVDSKMLVGTVKTESDKVEQAAPLTYSCSERMLVRLTSRIGLKHIHRISSFKIPQHLWVKEADILNFHNLHTGFFNYLTIPQLTANKHAIFTLHDMWSFTGHCAYSYDCDRWQSGCGQCPYPETYPSIRADATAIEWRLKDWVYNRSNLTIVCPSRWLYEKAQNSMLNRFPIHHIPYGIDTDAYQPIDASLSRTALGLPLNNKILLFGAESLLDLRKGGDLLQIALQSLPESTKTETILLTLGAGGEAIGNLVGIKTMSLGYVSSDRLKSMAYSAADLFIFPTRADNLPLVLQESMACGTPMVSFKVGGVPDLVRPGITGYLATPEDPQDFSQGIVQLLEDTSLRRKMAQNCRAIALKEYSLNLQTERYIKVYCDRLGAK